MKPMPAESAAQRRILVVDDDRIVLTLLSNALDVAGYEVRTALSSASALDTMSTWTPDLSILDIDMPGMSGLELAKRLHMETYATFMFLSSHQDIEIVKAATEYGAVGYLVKPIDVTQLIPAVEAALARGNEIRHLRRTEVNLMAALNAGRETSMAVGLLMARYQTDRNTAFEVLRDYARSNRRKMNEIASELLAAEELLNVFSGMFK